jgi:hypothetical protein
MIEELIYYKVICDGCGHDAHEDGEYSAYADDSTAREDAANVDYLTEIGPARLDFCPKCAPERNHGDHADCDHEEVLTVGHRQWKCDACGLQFGDPKTR